MLLLIKLTGANNGMIGILAVFLDRFDDRIAVGRNVGISSAWDDAIIQVVNDNKAVVYAVAWLNILVVVI